MAEWLCEDGRECAARPRDASACIGCDLKGQCADDHVEDTLHQEAHTGEPLDRAKTVHGSIVRRFLPYDSGVRDLELGGYRAKLAERRVDDTGVLNWTRIRPHLQHAWVEES